MSSRSNSAPSWKRAALPARPGTAGKMRISRRSPRPAASRARFSEMLPCDRIGMSVVRQALDRRHRILFENRRVLPSERLFERAGEHDPVLADLGALLPPI